MIQSKDRSMWIGASDTKFVVGNYKTATWEKWWRQKLGLNKDHFETEAMKVGTHLEHKVLDFISTEIEMDKQILIPEMRLRVNYDGNKGNQIYEVKTHKDDFKVTKPYWQQAQVEMFAWKLVNNVVPDLYIAAYQVNEEDYKNFFAQVDGDRLAFYPIEYDEHFIDEEYLPKLLKLKECIDKGISP